MYQLYSFIPNGAILYLKDGLNKQYDLIFSGQFIDRKQPLFFVEVVNEVAKSFDGLKILILTKKHYLI